MGRRLIALYAAMFMLFAGPASAADAPLAGRYSNVRYIAEADDYVGLNLEIGPGSAPSVSYELCEGWCNGPHSFPARVADGVLRFTVREDLFDAEGKPVAPTVYRVEARPKRTALGRRLVVTSPDLEGFRLVLRPVAPLR